MADFWLAEIDLAKNLYQNATLEKIEFIRTLSARDKRLDDAMTGWNEDIGVRKGFWRRSAQLFWSDILDSCHPNGHRCKEVW